MAAPAAFGDPIVVEAAEVGVTITNPDKPLFAKMGLTKLDVVRYVLAVQDPLMRWIRNRPVLLERFPNGVPGTSFFQKRVPDRRPDWLSTATVTTINGTSSTALVIADIAHVLWAVNLGAFGLHVWPFRVDAPQWSDELRIDLDPAPGQTFADVVAAAKEVRQYLGEHGIEGYVKTTGSAGLHVFVPLADGFDAFAVRGAAVTVARDLAKRRPDLITDQWWKESRGNRVFLDFNQNAPHKNLFGAWGIRPRVGAQVSTPIWWDAIDDIDPNALSAPRIPARLASQGDPWASMQNHRCDISVLVERFTDDLADGVPDAPWPPVYPKMPNEAPRVQPSRAARREPS